MWKKKLFFLLFFIPCFTFANNLSITEKLIEWNEEYNKEIKQEVKENDPTIISIDKHSFIPILSKEDSEKEFFADCILYYDGCDFYQDHNWKKRTKLSCEIERKAECLLSKEDFEGKASITKNWNKEEYLNFLIEKELKAYPYVNYHIEGFQERLESKKDLIIIWFITLIWLVILGKMYFSFKKKKDKYKMYELDKKIYGNIGLQAIEDRKNMEAIIKNNQNQNEKDSKDIFDF